MMITIPEAVHALREGRLVAFPTETVYGLGADACNPRAVPLIFEAKGRPERRALICHVTDAEMARRCVVAEWSPQAELLGNRFWPGPLTLILPRAGAIPDAVTGGGETVGVRAPNHPMALELIAAFGGPIAAPSANRFGEPPPVNAQQVEAAFGSHPEVSILDGGTTPGGLESTVLDLSVSAPIVRRAGAVPVEELETLLGATIKPDRPVSESRDSKATGMAIRFLPDEWPDLQRRLEESDVVLAFRVEWDQPGRMPLPSSDDECARRLFDALHKARERTASCSPPGRVYIEWPEESRFSGGLWPSIRERILRHSRPLEE